MRRFPEPEKSQYFDSAFSAYPTLNPLSAVPISWRALLPTVLPPGSTSPTFPGSGRSNRTPVGLPAGRSFPFFTEPGPIDRHPGQTFMNFDDTKIAVGKYLVSPLAKQHAEGRFAASVSIRSGRGSATHDRVLRFSGLFDSAAAAIHYATEHAMGWIQERSPQACA